MQKIAYYRAGWGGPGALSLIQSFDTGRAFTQNYQIPFHAAPEDPLFRAQPYPGDRPDGIKRKIAQRLLPFIFFFSPGSEKVEPPNFGPTNMESRVGDYCSTDQYAEPLSSRQGEEIK